MEIRSKHLSICFLGCGKLNSALLEGILGSRSSDLDGFAFPLANSEKEERLAIAVQPGDITACVKSHPSAKPLIDKYASKGIEVFANENVRAVKSADIVILGVEPNGFKEVLREPGMRDAMAGKILVSIIGGVNTNMLASALYESGSPPNEENQETLCQFIRVLPNTAAAARKSISLIIQEGKGPYPSDVLDPVCSLFLRVGIIKMWSEELGPAGATLSASTLAFWAMVVEGAVDGAMKLGINRAEAIEIVAATMNGAAALIQSGESPFELRRKVATPGGSTAVGLKLLEDRQVKSALEEALTGSVRKASGLGQKTISE